MLRLLERGSPDASHQWKAVTLALAAGVHDLSIDLTTSGGTDPAFIAEVLGHSNMGATRMLWGSDGVWGAQQSPDAIRQNLDRAGASQEDQALILGDNAARLVRLGPASVKC